MYHFESLDSRNVHEGDSRKIQDQAVDVHSWNTDACRKLQLRRNDADITEIVELFALLLGLLSFIDQIP